VVGGALARAREVRDHGRHEPIRRGGTMSTAFEVEGKSPTAPFTLKAHRGDGMVLLAMNWRQGTPPNDFVGFGIELKEPGGARWRPVKNRLSFPGLGGAVDPNVYSTLRSPIQKFRWIHFPLNADLPGAFTYRVTPVFSTGAGDLSLGEAQVLEIELRRETYPRRLNVAFTRGFVSSQAFVDRYGKDGPITTLIPADADEGLTFVSTHPKAQEAYKWMGFEARSAILELLDEAIADAQAQVRVVAYDLNLPDIVSRLAQLGSRLRIIVDDSDKHGRATSAESQAATILSESAGAANVIRQHVGHLQHNKTIVVDGPKVKAAVCGSTNMSWRGFFVQSNNAVIVRGAKAIAPFAAAFDDYWNHGTPDAFGATASADWKPLRLASIDSEVAFSPHSAQNAKLDSTATDIRTNTTSSLLYSLAFLYQTPGAIQDAIKATMQDPSLFVYGISDRKVGGLDVQSPDGRIAPVYPSQLSGKGVPEPFKSEPTGGSGVRMHHKFVVIDFDKPTARVYLGSYNFSKAADTQNGENLVLIRDRRVAVSYAVEALSMFDHYLFRVLQADAKKRKTKLQLARPPSSAGEKPWWDEDYTNARKIRDRELFA
jgi:phosphatidylserine/phosphatidylglycerophosphate/cardiolipin synthase-like enzyme